MRKNKIKQSNYYYEQNDGTIILRKNFLSKSNAITTLVYFSIIIPTFTMMILSDDFNNENLVGSIYMSLVTIAFTGFFIYCIISLIWHPVLYIFNDDYFYNYKTKVKTFYYEINNIEILSFKSEETFRLKFKVNNLSLIIHLKDERIVKLIEISNTTNMKEINLFKNIIEQLIFKKHNQ